VFALLVASCCDKCGTSCYHLVTRLMTVTDLRQVVPTGLIQAVFVTSCYELVVINLLTTCYVQTISDLLDQLVASLSASSTLFSDLSTAGNKQCEHILLPGCEISFSLLYRYVYWHGVSHCWRRDMRGRENVTLFKTD
jgi:hypothetical protein